MRVAMMTKEYPPEIYGGAGVHVAELTRHMRDIVDVDVHCMGAPRNEDNVYTYGVDPELTSANAALQTMSTGLRMAHAAAHTDVVHSHTWYTGLGGHLAGLLHEVPHIVTAHSLEPDRPWKREQLGGGYDVSSWSEQNAMEYADAVIAVSAGMKDAILRAYPRIDADKIRVVLNGIDTQLWQPRPTFDDAEHSVLRDHGIKPDQPIVAFVGRITRQKGVEHLVKAARHFSPGVQLVLCAGAPDTPEIAARTQHLVEELQAEREGVVWVQEMLSKDKIQEILTAADAFVCPSIYEPLGIVNLEAMACATAVVASDVGGIPEVVVDGTTGSLVHYDPNDTDTFEHDLAEAVNAMVADRKRAAAFGVTGRNRAVSEFSWGSIAQQTVDVYSSLL
ncbi:glycogen synthase [Corynebacterium belfantii]|uniref:glycogen synthase n=1 Tax=Corynebacterium belfantii TaxID=2014537 RepID=UPI000B4B2E08|nr:glycogen synthase [Corynebacterium belfantii]OWM38824.1 glycosyl transferase family 1 [Corynebacterium diphtheriae subsp. lausannense]MBG9258068.1 glycogen synthase [Corynebacterium belfantii]MBG9264694.1 glycogen synthase [Corynebacterium belfantii]MBG9299403.1 glycogen synthase [Corynebacterium belfantii]MBG9307679.1 glycogen synthase [Corynebacterium belfantii]